MSEDPLLEDHRSRPPRTLALLIHDLQSGGAQRVMSLLANAWVEEGWEVLLLTLDVEGSPSFFPLDARVKRIHLGGQVRAQGIFSKLKNNVERVRGLRRVLRETRPTLLISFIEKVNVLALLASRGLGLPVIISERVDPRSFVIGPVWSLLRRWTYPFATTLVVQVESVRDFFPKSVQNRTQVIPNPVPPPGAHSPLSGVPRPRVLAAGRLDPYKGFDLLIEAFARCAGGHPEWTLDILGEGYLRPILEAQILQAGLDARVRLLGNRSDMAAHMKSADIFVLSSRAEGFPNVLCEAMAAGLPVLSFDCPTGPRDIIRNGIDGLIVPPEDVSALTEGLDRLMSDSELRTLLSSRAGEVVERFGVESILSQWRECMDRAIGATS